MQNTPSSDPGWTTPKENGGTSVFRTTLSSGPGWTALSGPRRCSICEKDYTVHSGNFRYELSLDLQTINLDKMVCPSCGRGLVGVFDLSEMPGKYRWDILAESLDGIDPRSLHEDLAIVSFSNNRLNRSISVLHHDNLTEAEQKALESLKSHIDYQRLLQLRIEYYKSIEHH